MKSQTLSLRLDPKTRFVLEFVAKLNRQSITTVVEEAVRRAGDAATVGGEPRDFGSRSWRAFWDVSEGVRALKMLADPDLPSDYEDDELREFVEQHIEFFSESGRLGDPDRINVRVLWPNIEEYMTAWREAKRQRPFEVGAKMADALTGAGVSPPAWPPAKRPARTSNSELDDEIPF